MPSAAVNRQPTAAGQGHFECAVWSACVCSRLILFACLRQDLIRSFEVQLSERDERVASMASELESCYARLGENESEHVRRREEDRLSISESRRPRHLCFLL